jgi:hypothetical protein
MAGLGKKTFVAGEVLLAQEVNGYLMDQSVMVFGGTAARSSAIPTPTEGMMSYRTDDDVVEVFNGSAYVGVGGATSALTLVSTTTIGTAVASVTVSGAFSATYERYKILVTGGTSSATVDSTTFKLGASATGYYFGAAAGLFTSGSPVVIGNNNLTAWSFLWRPNTTNISLDFELTNPFLAVPTLIKASAVGSDRGFAGAGVHGVSTSFTDFTIALTGGTLTGGTIYVYGYQK